MIDISTTAAEIQTRISALTSPVAPDLILKHAVDSKGLDLDLSNLITVLNTADALTDNTTSEKDLIALNAARIAIESNLQPWKMPLTAQSWSNIRAYDHAGVTRVSSTSEFFSATFGTLSSYDTGFDGDYTTVAFSANVDKEIINYLGEGMLTQVISPCIVGVPCTITITVTRDGTKVDVFELEVANANQRVLLGDFRPYSISTGNGQMVGGSVDSGFQTSASTMPTPIQTAIETDIGMTFKKSLVVSIKSSLDITSIPYRYAGVIFLTNKVKGG